MCCGGLNENGPHRLIRLDTSSWLVNYLERMRYDLVGEVVSWRGVFEVSTDSYYPQCVLLLLLKVQDVSSQLSLLPCLLSLITDANPLELTYKPNSILSFLSFFGHGALLQ